MEYKNTAYPNGVVSFSGVLILVLMEYKNTMLEFVRIPTPQEVLILVLMEYKNTSLRVYAGKWEVVLILVLMEYKNTFIFVFGACTDEQS